MTTETDLTLSDAKRAVFERAFSVHYPGRDLTFHPKTGYLYPTVHHASIGWMLHAAEPDATNAIAMWELEPSGWETISSAADLMMTLPPGTRLYYLPGGPPATATAPTRARDMAIARAVRDACLASTDAGGIADDVRNTISNLNLSNILGAAKLDGRNCAAPQTPTSVPEPESRDIMAICDAYESGIGHGLRNDGHSSGATFADPDHGRAYEIGYSEGVRRAGATAQCDSKGAA
jgi:hypothetical protein